MTDLVSLGAGSSGLFAAFGSEGLGLAALNAGLAGGLVGFASTGKLSGALISAGSAAAFAGLVPDPIGAGDIATISLNNVADRFIVGGFIGGLTSVAEGGKFASGFLAGGFGTLAGSLNGNGFSPQGAVESVVLGGFGSELGGGKFANGAITGAFAYAVESGAQGESSNGSPQQAAPDQSNSGFTSQPADSLIAVVYKIFNGIPTDAVLYTAPNGVQFWGPLNANFSLAYQAGQAASSMSLADQKNFIESLIGQGGIFDYQRSGGVFIPAYTNASNFAVGLVMEAAGYSWNATEAIAGLFAMSMSYQGWTNIQTY